MACDNLLWYQSWPHCIQALLEMQLQPAVLNSSDLVGCVQSCAATHNVRMVKELASALLARWAARKKSSAPSRPGGTQPIKALLESTVGNISTGPVSDSMQ